MKILVLISNVPDTTTKIRFVDNNKAFDTTGVQWIINPWDELALTRAVELKEAGGVETITVANVGESITEPTYSYVPSLSPIEITYSHKVESLGLLWPCWFNGIIGGNNNIWNNIYWYCYASPAESFLIERGTYPYPVAFVTHIYFVWRQSVGLKQSTPYDPIK